MTEKSKQILTKLFKAADNHGEGSGDQDYTVGDLQGLLQNAWGLMTVSQRLAFLATPEIEALVDIGAEGDFTQEDLTETLTESVVEMELAVREAGYRLLESDFIFYWEINDETCPDFPERGDMVGDAYKHLQSKL